MKKLGTGISHIIKLLLIAMIFCASFLEPAQAAKVSKLRFGQGVGIIRAVFDADNEFDYNVFLLSNPRRLVVDIYNAKVDFSTENAENFKSFISEPRIGKGPDGGTRVVFDLHQPLIVKKLFMLKPQSILNWRFAVDLAPVTADEFAQNVGGSHAFSKGNVLSSDKTTSDARAVADKPQKSRYMRKIIVLDPGHGGGDSGAIGISGVYEKNITLAMAKELKQVLDKSGKYKVYLTRNRDVFIPLRKRVQIGRNYKADLFLSIHADSAKNHKATGLSIYTLSERASDKEAEALAEKENRSDIIDGVDFSDKTPEVSDFLISLAQRDNLNKSCDLADSIVHEMHKYIHTVPNSHRFAGFAVLKAPDVPSALMELGYLSNRKEESLLRQKWYRLKLANLTAKAIDNYFAKLDKTTAY